MRALHQLICVLFAAACASQQPDAPSRGALQSELRERAFGAENQGRFADAAAAFAQLCTLEPERAEWVVASGRCLGRAGRFKEAIDLLDAARARFPAVIDVPAMLARTLLLQAESSGGVVEPRVLWADAADLAEGVLKLDPDHEDGRLVLAQAHYLLGRTDDAVADAEEAVRRHPTRAGAHVLLGRIAADRLRALLQRFENARPADPAAEAAAVAAIEVQRTRARQEFTRAAELDPLRAHPHVALAQLALLDKDDKGARSHLLDALSIDPDAVVDLGPIDHAGDWQARRGAYAKALEHYLARDGARAQKAATLRFHEGRALYDGEQWREALQCFEAALKDQPEAGNAHFYASLCAFRLDDHDGAEAHAAAYAAIGAAAFADVIRGLSGDRRGEVGAIVRFLADRAYQKGRIDKSRDLNHVIACLLDSADAWNNHAFLCRETGRFDDALASYRSALEKEPDSPQLLNDAAVILQYHLKSDEHTKQARSMYERALQLADKVLADATATSEQRERAKKAKQDATANLAELGR